MDIQQAVAPASPKPQAIDKTPVADRNDVGAEPSNGQTSVSAFSSLLQGLQQTAEDVCALPQPEQATLVPETMVEPLAMPLSMEDLLGQTQRLDAPPSVPDVAMNSMQQPIQPDHVQPALREGAQRHVAIGQQVATVAAGVQPAPNTAAALDAAPAMAASAVLMQAVDASEAVEQAVTVDADRDVMPEGRMALEGVWTMEDAKTELSPALQRVMMQVTQWAAASAGATAKPDTRVEAGKGVTAAGVEALLGSGQGSGMQLTDNAVREVQQAQDAMFEAQQDVPVEDMRFWLQGKQQRAEVVLQKDGQPVRVQVAVRGNEAHVVFSADQASTRELLDEHVEQLRSMLAQQGVELSSLQVQADAQGQSSGQQEGSRNSPWGEPAVRYGQVQVPVEQAPALRPARNQGLDLYA